MSPQDAHTLTRTQQGLTAQALAIQGGPDSAYAWVRLATAVLLSTIGGVGMWSVPVAIPALQADFAITRGSASLAFTATMLGFATGGIMMGRLTDRFGVVRPLIGGILLIGIGYVAAGLAPEFWQFAVVQGALIGFFGCSATFGPLIADISHWFIKRRGIAVGICASGNYLAGTVWPPVLQYFIAAYGWRQTHIGVGIFCVLTMLPLLFIMRPRLPRVEAGAVVSMAAPARTLGVSGNTLQGLLIVAGIACCVAMSMPQVHLVAYCGDLGYGIQNGARMLSVMLAAGIVSRLASGWISDKIGGVATLLLGSLLQGTALSLYLFFDELLSLYIISALFGLFQGGIVPSYTIIVREYFPSAQAGTRVGLVLMATLVGMALGGWMTGAIYDLTGSYQVAFLNGIAWNLANVSIVAWLMLRSSRRTAGLVAA